MTLAFREAKVPDSPLARWDSRWKLAAILLAAFGFAALRSPVAAGLAGLLAVGLVLVGRVPVRAVRDRLLLVGLAVLPVVIVVPLSTLPGEATWAVGPVSVSRPGLTAAVAVAFRAMAIGTLALALVRTAPLPRTLAAAHALRIPGVLIQIAQLAYRYAFLLAAEARRTQIALRTRGFRPRTDAHTYRTMGQAVGGLLVRGGDRAEGVAAAMRCRGFDGTFRQLAEFRTRPADVISFLAVAASTIALVAVDRME